MIQCVYMEPLDMKLPSAGQGRPVFTDNQFSRWLEELAPHLKKGNSLYYCCGKSGLDNHYDVILRKYNLGDWFSKKVDAYRSYPGEMVNDAITKLVTAINEKIVQGIACTKDELDMLKFYAEKHRTSQPFFVTRTEQAQSDPSKVGKVLDVVEATDYQYVGQQAQGQMVETDAPIQD